MTPPLRLALWLLALTGALAGAGALARSRGGLETLLLVLPLVWLGPALRRALVLRGWPAVPCWATAVEVLACTGLATYPVGTWSHALLAIVAARSAFEVAPATETPASRLERSALGAAAAASLLGPIVLGAPQPLLLALAAAVVGLEATRLPWTSGRSLRWATALALGGAGTVLAGYEGPTTRLPLAHDAVAVALSVLLVRALADLARARSTASPALRAESRRRTWLALLGGAAFLATFERGLGVGVVVRAIAFSTPALLPSPRPRLEAAIWGWAALAILLGRHDVLGDLVPLLGVAPSAALLCAQGLLAAATVHAAWSALGAAARLAGVTATAVAGGTILLGGEVLAPSREFVLLIQPAVTPVVGSSNLLEAGGSVTDFRERSFGHAPPPGVRRIALVGASSAWGHAQRLRETSPSGVLERALAARGSPTEVMCLASPGMTSDHSLGQVAVFARGWAIDLFLVVDTYNDMHFLAHPDATPGEIYFWRQHLVGLDHPLRRALLQRRLLPAGLLTRGMSLPPRPEAEVERENGYWLAGLTTNEEAMTLLARAGGASVAWSRAPLHFDVHGPRADEPRYRDLFRARCDEVERRVAPAVSRAGGYVLDLPVRMRDRAAVLASDEVLFVDRCHYTDRGVEVLVDAILGELERVGWLR